MKATKKSKSRNVKKPINPKMSFAEVLKRYPQSAEVFFKHNMSCFGCPAAMMERLEDGIKAHGESVEKIIKELNEAVKKRK